METIIKIDENGFEINGVRHEHPQPAEAAKTWPRFGDQYWYLDGFGHVFATRWDATSVNKVHRSTGNCFRTREEAEECKVADNFTIYSRGDTLNDRGVEYVLNHYPHGVKGNEDNGFEGELNKDWHTAMEYTGYREAVKDARNNRCAECEENSN